eukprot:TRINITY_DN46934_c0_g1_i1.p1 TRINITY_DN46934_c0_g1~~TRINITY_DN46934_c0_g1_i1.p1  ORF type:complete len:264 (+),score=45.03 TRINITY_DN46934_c0_g1_i1:99-794(+)
MAQLLLLTTMILSSEAWALCEPDLEPASMPLIEAAAVLMGFIAFGVFTRLKDRSLSSEERAEPVQRTPVSKEKTDVWGCTELHVAASAGLNLEVRRLLEGGSDANARDAWCETPLHMAARAGHLESAGLLLSMGAELHATNADDETPLVLAVREGHKNVCVLLLGNRAAVGDASVKDLPQLRASLLPDDAGHRSGSAGQCRLPNLLGRQTSQVQRSTIAADRRSSRKWGWG